jgi:hypothetical protein
VKLTEPRFLLLLATGWLAAFLFYLPLPIDHDASWYLLSTGRILDGERAYRDIIELNPPLAFYLMMPPVAAARLTGLSPEHCFVGYLFLLSAASLALAHRLLASLPRSSLLYRRGMLVATLGAFALIPTPFFGEREHLMFILVLPYLLLAASRLTGGSCRFGLAVVIGALGATGFGVKPYFLLVPVLLEIYAIALTRSIRFAFRPETWMLGIGIGLYGASIVLLNPDYLNFIVPMTSLVYGAYAAPMNAVIRAMPLLAFGLATVMYVVTRLSRPANRTTDVFALAAVGFTAAYLVQQKGWLYQLIPGTAAMWLTAASVLLGIIEQRAENKGQKGSNAMLYGAVAALAYLLIGPQMTGHYRNPLADDLMPVVQKHAGEGAIFAFTSDVWVAFPLVNEAHVGWASRFPAQWLLPGVVVQLTQSDPMDPARRQKLQEVERYSVDAVIEDLNKTPPDIVIVDDGSPFFGHGSFDYLAYFGRDPRFVEFWQPYVKIGETSIKLPGERKFEVWCRRYAKHDCAG